MTAPRTPRGIVETCMFRAAIQVDLGAISRNCQRLRALAPTSSLCAVVKANGYGHGALAVADAALAGGASHIAVATADEAAELRSTGISCPILVLGALGAEELRIAVDARAELVAWRWGFVEQARAVARSRRRAIRIHVKLDVGMGRLGTRDSAALLALAYHVCSVPELELVGGMTHLPCADEDPERSRAELAQFGQFSAELRRLKPNVVVHAANSAATLGIPTSRLDMVRCGVAIYGMDPFGVNAAAHGLQPALELHSYAAVIKPLARRRVGWVWRSLRSHQTYVDRDTADRIRRWVAARISENADVLIEGRRYPIVGRISIDNTTVDVGPEKPTFREGAQAILIGRDGDQQVTAEEFAPRIGTITTVTTGLSSRPRRTYITSQPEKIRRVPKRGGLPAKNEVEVVQAGRRVGPRANAVRDKLNCRQDNSDRFAGC